MHGVRAGFCPLGELVQGDRYGRRPPGRSPGRAPRRGVPPRRRPRGGPGGGACGRPLRPAQAVKRESVPCAAAMLPALPLPGRRGLCCGVGAGLLPFGRVGAGGWIRPQAARAKHGQGAPPGRLPAAEQRGPAAGLLRPAQAVKRESDPAPPRKSTHFIYIG